MKQILTLLFSVIAICVFAQMPATLTPAEKVYGLSTFWQEVNYNFVFMYKVDKEKWENDYIRLIGEVQETENDYEYYRLLEKFCATLKDGHTNIILPKSIRGNLLSYSFGDSKFVLTNIDGKAIVIQINSDKKEEIPIGTEIIKVNGTPASEYLQKEVKPYISSSTTHILDDLSVRWMFRAPIGTSYDITFRLPNGEIKEKNLTISKTPKFEMYPPKKTTPLFEFKWLKNKTAYVALNSFMESEIDSLFIDKLPELYNAKKLIIDLRKNEGGVSIYGTNILQYLTNDTVLYGYRSMTRELNSKHKAWGYYLTPADTIKEEHEWGLSRETRKKSYLMSKGEYYVHTSPSPEPVDLGIKRLVIPTVVLIGHTTASAAEDFLIYADKLEHFTLIGEPTCGSTGQPLFLDLPGGAKARVCTKNVTYPDGKEFIGVGILPDVKVKKTLYDFVNQRDPVLDEAIKYLKN